jgi:crossover junction endodeoxyribonuclease RuvC
MKILGFDVGSKNLGYSICEFEKERCSLLLAGTLVMTHPEISQRLVVANNLISNLIKDYSIEAIGYEAPYMNKGANAMGLYFVAGLINLKAGQFNLPVVPLSPATVKKEVTGSGKAEKVQVEKKVKELLQPFTSETISFNTDHESDAAAICITTSKKLLK